MKIRMLRGAGEILALLDRAQNVDPDCIFVRRDVDVSNRVLPSPVLLNRMAEEFRKRVQIVTQSDVANLVLSHAPGHVELDPCFVDVAHCLASEKFLRTRETRRDPEVAVRV